MFTFTTIYEYLKLNLEKVGSVKVEVWDIDFNSLNLTRIFEEKILNLPSKRVDIVLSHLYNLSRSDIDKKVTKGDLFINSSKILSKTKEIKINDIISFRGCGKCKVEFFDINKKGKYTAKLLIYK